MCYSQWRDVYNQFFACLDFPSEWDAIRYTTAWNEQNSGGIPAKMTEEENIRWAKNP